MAFAPSTGLSALVADSTGALFNFAAATTVRNVRLTNLHTAAVNVTLWFDYDGTATGDVDCVLKTFAVNPGESLRLDGDVWHFGAGGRISGLASVTNKVSVHITPATI